MRKMAGGLFMSNWLAQHKKRAISRPKQRQEGKTAL
jgi:hypothetical protein